MRGANIESSARGAGKACWARRGAVLFAVGGALVACSGTGETGKEGNLGHGMFLYECDNDQDPACPPGLTTMAQDCQERYSNNVGVQCFPTSVALNGRFRMQFYPDPNLANLGNPVLNVVGAAYMKATGDGHFTGIKAGSVAVYAQSTVDSTLVDYTVVKIAPIAKLQMNDLTTKKGVPSQVTVAKAVQAGFALVAIDADAQKMAGAIETFSWELTGAKTTSFNLVDAANTATMHVGTTTTAVSGDAATLTAYADDSKTVKVSVNLVVQ
jgi:hypothetical protein